MLLLHFGDHARCVVQQGSILWQSHATGVVVVVVLHGGVLGQSHAVGTGRRSFDGVGDADARRAYMFVHGLIVLLSIGGHYHSGGVLLNINNDIGALRVAQMVVLVFGYGFESLLVARLLLLQVFHLHSGLVLLIVHPGEDHHVENQKRAPNGNGYAQGGAVGSESCSLEAGQRV